MLGLLLTVGSAEARDHTYGQGPGLGDNQGTRAPNLTIFQTKDGDDGDDSTTPAQEFANDPDELRPRFVIDSSLPNTRWWATEEFPPDTFDSVQGANVTGDKFVMQALDPVPLGGSFYFGFSWENNVERPKNYHGIFGDGSYFRDAGNNPLPNDLRLPEDTVVYMGMSRFGAARNPTDILNSIDIDDVDNTDAFTAALAGPPLGTFPGNPSAFGWVSTETNGDTGEISWEYDPPAGVQYEYTELVYVVVLPAAWSYVPGADDEDRFTFVWTVDSRGYDPDNPPDVNDNFGNILVPEPGRVVLVGFGMCWLLWRRRR